MCRRRENLFWLPFKCMYVCVNFPRKYTCTHRQFSAHKRERAHRTSAVARLQFVIEMQKIKSMYRFLGGRIVGKVCDAAVVAAFRRRGGVDTIPFIIHKQA